ncbi:NAD(+) diphosphatase [Agromyces mediolanus]|uniref:NAD(+) diphosphatase n=1 Tax=Agromyces mediolanus TaxID=41986 RepID=UPI0020413AB6|nr:NAD(+) diphosphatase [Agromyces mediolanus]MCM3656196.1 NAD(+) diphosphatase [Agromyces mediolanus]
MPESSLPPLARAAIDRDAGARADPERESRFDADASALVLPVHDGRLLLAEQHEGSAPELGFVAPVGLPAETLRCYLGRIERGGTSVAVELRVYDEAAAATIEAEAGRWAQLRRAAALLDDRDQALAVEAIALTAWHEAHPFCPRCGSPTEVTDAGWVRRCVAEERQLFPRTDPAVIVLVTDDDDRVLLGSNALWEQRRFSLLAGFVEPGEPLEHAVVREIGEEAGIPVDRVEYAASQPWPLPASLMLGFRARLAAGAAPGIARPDGEEILELRWFSREDIAAAGEELSLPTGTSIAGWMLEHWYGGPLPTDVPWPSS